MLRVANYLYRVSDLIICDRKMNLENFLEDPSKCLGAFRSRIIVRKTDIDKVIRQRGESFLWKDALMVAVKCH